jgi:hypothetical protein
MARGIPNNSIGGAYDVRAQTDIIDCDPFQGPATILTGTADVLNAHSLGSANYIVNNTTAADLTTLAAPLVGVDDGLCIAFWSNTAFAHKITCPTTLIQNGAATPKTSATLAAFAGAGILLRAFNGNWQVISTTGTVTYA